MKKQKRVRLTPYATARVDEDCPKETLLLLKKMAEMAYETPIEKLKKEKS